MGIIHNGKIEAIHVLSDVWKRIEAEKRVPGIGLEVEILENS
jgi:hypothetical protein